MNREEMGVLLEDIRDKFQLVAEGLRGVNQRLDRVEDAVARLAARQESFEIRSAAALSTFREEIFVRFGEVESRLDRVENRLDRVEARLAQVETGLAEVRTEVAGLRQDRRLSELESRVSRLEHGPRPPRGRS